MVLRCTPLSINLRLSICVIFSLHTAFMKVGSFSLTIIVVLGLWLWNLIWAWNLQGVNYISKLRINITLLKGEDSDTVIEGEFSIWFRDNVSGIYVRDSHYFLIFLVLYHWLKHANGLDAKTSAYWCESTQISLSDIIGSTQCRQNLVHLLCEWI